MLSRLERFVYTAAYPLEHHVAVVFEMINAMLNLKYLNIQLRDQDQSISAAEEGPSSRGFMGFQKYAAKHAMFMVIFTAHKLIAQSARFLCLEHSLLEFQTADVRSDEPTTYHRGDFDTWLDGAMSYHKDGLWRKITDNTYTGNPNLQDRRDRPIR
jgi:hypothetical protein